MVITLLQHITYVGCCCWTSVKLTQVACMFENQSHKTLRADSNNVTQWLSLLNLIV